MRIFYASGASPNAYYIKSSTLWKSNLFDSLVQMGHDLKAFSKDVTWHFTEYLNYQHSETEAAEFLKYKSYLQVELLKEIRAEHQREKIDVFFSYFWSEMCDPETIEAIKAMGITTVNWFCNASYQFDLVADLAPHYDYCLVPEKFRLSHYRAIGARPLYCQEAANPQVYKPYNVPVEFDVTFVGQAYGDRPGYLEYLSEQGIDVRVWGTGWASIPITTPVPEPATLMNRARRLGGALGRRAFAAPFINRTGKSNGDLAMASPPSKITYGGILSDDELIKTYSRSKINLGFSSCGDTHQESERILQIRLRDFEVPMSGGFYMVEYMEDLEEFYEVGKEVACYTNREDLAEKIKYYLTHDREREAIRKAGHQRCLRDHTWQKRFEAAFKEMGLS